ncbi:MAG: HDOD domain-containing protein [Thermodesulfobacteriota bacterium]
MGKTGEEDTRIFQKRLKLFRKIEFFKDFEDDELLQFQTVSSWLKVLPGTRIIQEGTSEKAFYIIVQGKVSVDKAGQEEGETVELTTLESGDTFGEMAIVSEVKRTAGVKTLTECYLVRVEPDILSNATVFLQLKFYRRFCEILVERLIRSNLKATMFSFGSSGEEGREKEKKIDREKKKPQGSGRQVEEGVHKNRDIDPSDLPPVPRKKKITPAKMQHRIQSRLEIQINPGIAGQLLPLLENANTASARKMLDLIAMDPVLATRVLQVANSSWYRRTFPVQTLAHAMINVGVTHLQEILAKDDLGMVTLNGFGGIASLASSFWRHSVVVGRIADILRDTISIKLEEDSYLAGLLHDLGTLVVDREEPEFYPQLLRPDFFSGNINEQEKAYSGIDHTWAGYWYGEKIGLPKPYLDVILFHHAPDKAKNNELLVALIHLGDLFARQCGISMALEEDKRREIINSPAWAIIQERHKSFFEVNIQSFIDSFNTELDRSWQTIVEDIQLL